MSKKLLNGHEVEEVSEEEGKEMDLDIFTHGLVHIKPEGWLYPASTAAFLDRMYNIKVHTHARLVCSLRCVTYSCLPYLSPGRTNDLAALTLLLPNTAAPRTSFDLTTSWL